MFDICFLNIRKPCCLQISWWWQMANVNFIMPEVWATGLGLQRKKDISNLIGMKLLLGMIWNDDRSQNLLVNDRSIINLNEYIGNDICLYFFDFEIYHHKVNWKLYYAWPPVGLLEIWQISKKSMNCYCGYFWKTMSGSTIWWKLFEVFFRGWIPKLCFVRFISHGFFSYLAAGKWT